MVFDTSFYTALYAKGRIRENAFISSTVGFLVLPVSYVLFKIGFSPLAVAWSLFGAYGIIGLVVKPILIIKIAGYTWKDIFSVFKPCFKVFVISSILPVFLYVNKESLFTNEIIGFACLAATSICSVCCCVWFLGLDKKMRNMLIENVKSRLTKKQRRVDEP